MYIGTATLISQQATIDFVLASDNSKLSDCISQETMAGRRPPTGTAPGAWVSMALLDTT
jgi:hypothetical protein